MPTFVTSVKVHCGRHYHLISLSKRGRLYFHDHPEGFARHEALLELGGTPVGCHTFLRNWLAWTEKFSSHIGKSSRYETIPPLNMFNEVHTGKGLPRLARRTYLRLRPDRKVLPGLPRGDLAPIELMSRIRTELVTRGHKNISYASNHVKVGNEVTLLLQAHGPSHSRHYSSGVHSDSWNGAEYRMEILKSDYGDLWPLNTLVETVEVGLILRAIHLAAKRNHAACCAESDRCRADLDKLMTENSKEVSRGYINYDQSGPSYSFKLDLNYINVFASRQIGHEWVEFKKKLGGLVRSSARRLASPYRFPGKPGYGLGGKPLPRFVDQEKDGDE